MLYTATDMGVVIAWQNQEERGGQWVKLEEQWACVVGERISALAVAAGGAPALLVGMHSGAVRAITHPGGRRDR